METPSNTASTQETTSSATQTPATPAPTETTTTSTETTQATPVKTETWEYNGDRKAVPKEFETYVKGFDRYVTKKDQAHSEARKKAEEYDKLVSSDGYKQWQAQQQNPTGANHTQQIPDDVTQDELDAIMAGDAKTLKEVIKREAKRTVETEYKSEIERVRGVELKQRELETGEMIKSFSQVHPKFSEYIEDDNYYDFMLSNIQKGKSLDEVYASIEKVEQRASEKAVASQKELIEKKKNGSVVSSKVPGTADVVYAENEDQAKRLAIEMAIKNDPRQVQIKRK